MQNHTLAAQDVKDVFLCARFNDPLLQELNRFSPYVKEQVVEPLQFASIDDFFDVWQTVHQNLLFQINPALRNNSVVNALFVLLDSTRVKSDVKRHIDQREDIACGLLSWTESLQHQQIPYSCINELYHFVHATLYPQSRYFPNTDVLVTSALSLVEFISCGINQFDGFIFEECTVNNHAVLAAISSGKTVMMSVNPLPKWAHQKFVGYTQESSDICEIQLIDAL